MSRFLIKSASRGTEPRATNSVLNMRYKFQNIFSHIYLFDFVNILSLIALAFFTLILNTFLFNHNSIYKELEGAEPSLVAFANDTIIEEDAIVFANQIQKKAPILYIDYISKEENLNGAEKQFGPLGGVIKSAFSGNNPFPASLEIYVDTTEGSRKKLEELAFDIESYDEIDDVVLTGQGILTDIFHQTNRMTIASITIIILMTFIVLRTAVHKTAQKRHEEIQLLELIGATRGYLSIPFYCHGIFLGILGTILGLTCFYLLYRIFTFQLGVLEFLPYYQLCVIVGVGVIIGLFAGILAQQKYVKSSKKPIRYTSRNT